jgi:hypothetical protein
MAEQQEERKRIHNIKDYPDPLNISGDPTRSVFFWDENTPSKCKNMNKVPVKVGDKVFFEGNLLKPKILEGIIQIGAGSMQNDYYLAVFDGGKTKVNIKGCFHTRMEVLVHYPIVGVFFAGLVAALVIGIAYLLGGVTQGV